MIQDKRLPLKKKFLEYFQKVPIQKYAGAYIGKSEDTITRWKKADEDFADQIELAKAEYLKAKLIKVRSNEWILERLFKDHFSLRQEYAGAGGVPLAINVISYGSTDPLQLYTDGRSPSDDGRPTGQSPLSGSKLAPKGKKDNAGDKPANKVGKSS